MSCVAVDTRAVPSPCSSTFTSAGCRLAAHDPAAIPHPTTRPSRRIEPTVAVRFDQPNLSAPSVRHSARCRDENGTFRLSSMAGSLISRKWSGSILSLMASSSTADSSANKPGTAPGPRIDVLGAMSRRAGCRHLQVRRAVEIACRLTAILFACIQACCLIDVVLLQRCQTSIACCRQAYALLRARTVAHVVEHHLPGQHQLHGPP